MLITFSCEPSLYANFHLKLKRQSCQPIFGLWLLKKLLGCQVWGFFRGKCRELLECHEVPSKNPTPCSREQQSYPGATWASNEDDHIKRKPCISPEPAANANRQWGWVGWMLADHRDRLSSSSYFSLILDSSVGLSAGIQSAGDSVPDTFWVRILHSAEEDNLSPFDLKIACLCQSIKINNNKHVYRQSQVRMPTGSGGQWAKCSLVIGMGCWVRVFFKYKHTPLGINVLTNIRTRV